MLSNAEIPPQALALYARWWQLETWLRSLSYVELRARYGVEWVNKLDPGTVQRREKDRRHAYMASPDWEDPLAYLDAGKLFQLISDNWELFEPSLIDRDVWEGRRAELLKIRHRIGHLRRPHSDDLNRLEQTLRDLEPGTFRALSSYNRVHYVADQDEGNPVVAAWSKGKHSDAQRLLRHASEQYNTNLRLRFTVRPWANPPDPNAMVSGGCGWLWRVDFFQRGRFLDVSSLWRDSYLDISARQLLVHMLVSDITHVCFTFPAIEDAELISDAIGHLFDAVLTTSSWRFPGELHDIEDDPLSRLPALDPRVQVKTGWTFVDETTTPISIFDA